MAVDARGGEPALLPVAAPAEIASEPAEHCWLVQSLWTRSAVGVLGGAPKSCKSWLGLDMAVSVSSATACLGRLRIDRSGPALIYLAEDSPAMVRARIEAICAHRHLDLAALDLKLITAPALRLDLLGYLRELQRRHDLAVILVHHTSKKHRARPGLALRGSSDIHAFGDSNLYLARKDDKLTLTIEHRAAASPEPLTLQLVSRPDGSATHLEIASSTSADDKPVDQPPPLADQVVALLAKTSTPLYRARLRAELRVNNHRLGQALASLERAGTIVRTDQGWFLRSPATAKPDPHQLQLTG